MLDLNGDGVPDYEEPWFWKTVGGLIASIVKTFAHPNTIAYKAADAYQATIDKLGGGST